jgi:hypothetical protein
MDLLQEWGTQKLYTNFGDETSGESQFEKLK